MLKFKKKETSVLYHPYSIVDYYFPLLFSDISYNQKVITSKWILCFLQAHFICNWSPLFTLEEYSVHSFQLNPD